MRKAGQLGGALNPIGNADVTKLTAKLNQEMTAGGVNPQDAATAPPNTPSGKLHKIKQDIIIRPIMVLHPPREPSTYHKISRIIINKSNKRVII